MVKAKRKNSIPKTPKFSRWHAVPLKSSFMVSAMLGILISAYWVYPQNFNWGVTFMLVFGAMFIAALISMTKAPILEDPKRYLK